MSRDRQLAVWGLLLACTLLLVYLLRDVMMPFVAGMAVAYFLDPLADKLEKSVRSRTLAVVLILAGFLTVVIGAFLLIIPMLHGQIVGFASRLPDYVAFLREALAPVFEQIRLHLGEQDARGLLDSVGAEAGKTVQWAASLVGRLLSGGAALLSLLSLLVITPVVSFYLLRDWDDMVARVDSWLPRRAAPTLRHLVAETDRTIAGFVRGQATVCLVLGTFYAIGLSVAGLEFALLVGIGAGLISFVPYVGTIVGLGTGMGIALVQFDTIGPILAVAGVFAVGQVLEGYVLTPKLVGDRVGLHPVWVIFALLAGGALFGFTGLLLALPVAAVLGVLVRHGLSRYLASPMYTGEMAAKAAPASVPAPEPAPGSGQEADKEGETEA